MENILKHELSPVPLFLAKTNRQLLSAKNKADLQDILTEKTTAKILTNLPKSQSPTCLLIDAPGLIQVIGKPENASTFADLADVFSGIVKGKSGKGYSRDDILFGRCLETSIKDGTRFDWVGNMRPIRKVIYSRHVKLPQTLQQFITHSKNKAELASFLSNELMMSAKDLSEGHELIITGGFDDTNQAWSSCQSDVSQVKSSHKEADTRFILHVKEAKEVGYNRVVIQCRDTDVLVLAVGHRKHQPSQIWRSCGTSEKPKYIPVHAINYPPLVMDNVITYHSVTGCDTTNQFSGKAE